MWPFSNSNLVSINSRRFYPSDMVGLYEGSRSSKRTTFVRAAQIIGYSVVKAARGRVKVEVMGVGFLPIAEGWVEEAEVEVATK